MHQNCVWLPSLAFKVAVVAVALALPALKGRLSEREKECLTREPSSSLAFPFKY
jgi:hypothetical protein